MDADGDYGFDYIFTLTDFFMSINESADIDEVFQLINYHESGTGIAFGTVSKRTNALEFALPMYDRFDQLIPNGLAEYENGTIDANTTLSHLCLAQYNTPNNSFYYVMTLFYGGKELTSNRTQIAYPYIYDISQNKKHVYIRQHINGEWTEWRDISDDKYSTDEIIVGTWVDGKPIYRKYVTSILFTQSQQSWINALDISSYHIDTITHCTFYSSGNQNQGLTPQSSLLTQINGNYLQVYSNIVFEGFKSCLLEYTKTTD